MNKAVIEPSKVPAPPDLGRSLTRFFVIATLFALVVIATLFMGMGYPDKSAAPTKTAAPRPIPAPVGEKTGSDSPLPPKVAKADKAPEKPQVIVVERVVEKVVEKPAVVQTPWGPVSAEDMAALKAAQMERDTQPRRPPLPAPSYTRDSVNAPQGTLGTAGRAGTGMSPRINVQSIR
jgi:hypothetical protein